MSEWQKEEMLRLVPGGIYRYTRDLPRGCKDELYRIERFILDVPSYQHKVLVECLTGRDKGIWFCCSLANFAHRYERLPPEPEPERIIDLTTGTDL